MEQLTFELSEATENENFLLEKERNYFVVKSNELIQNSRFQLSLQEQKIVLYLISKIRPEDIELKSYTFEISEFCKLCGLDAGSGANYKYIRQTLKNLRDKSIWITLPDGSETTFAWVEQVTLYQKSGKAVIKINENMKPFLIDLQERFTKFELFYTLIMKSQYSPRLYEIMKSYEFVKEKTFTLEEIKKILAAEMYKNYADFKRRVIDVAIKEINELTDIKVFYKPNKKGKTVVSITFFIEKEKNVLKNLTARAKIEQKLAEKNH